MARQFDIVENANGDSRVRYPFLLILQHDRVGFLDTVIAAPLISSHHRPGTSKLHPSADVSGRLHFVLIEQLAAVPLRTLGPVAGSAESQRYAIIAALDLLFTGV